MAILEKSNDIIRTARLVLRRLRENDAARVFALFDHWEMVRYLSSPPWPYRPEDAEGFCRLRAQHVEGDPATLAITLEDALIGVIDVIHKPASAVQRAAGYSLGYWLGQPYWGRGYMSESARGYIAHVFETIPDDTIYSGAFNDNAASLRIQGKLGFERDGEAMLFANPQGKELPHTNTILTRTRFAAATAAA